MNSFDVYFKIYSVFFVFYRIALNCSALIDVLGYGTYNIYMENSVLQNHIMGEKAEPARRIIRSDGALYALLLLFTLGVIFLANAVSVLWNLPRLFVQLTLYLILFGLGYFVYRRYLVCFYYMLTDRMFTVDRIVGKKRRSDESVHLSDIVSIRPFRDAPGDLGKLRKLYVNNKRDTLALTVVAAGKRFTLLISPSQEFAGKLIEQWKTARKK